MRDKKKVFQLYWIKTEYICDYFYRLGGSGCYLGFKEWHPFACAALIALKVDCNNSDDEVMYELFQNPAISLDRIFNIKDLIKQSEFRINEIQCTKNDVADFIRQANETLIDRALKRSKSDRLSHMDLQELVDWGAFYSMFFNQLLLVLENSDRKRLHNEY